MNSGLFFRLTAVACAALLPLCGPSARAEEPPAPPSPRLPTVSLLFAGDLMLADGPGRLLDRQGDPLGPVTAWLQGADYRIANLECAVGTGGQPLANKIWTFRAAPTALRAVKGRIDAVSLANNHSGDYGKATFLETLTHLDTAGIARFGGGRNLAEAHRPLWIERDGLKIAILGYNEYKPRHFEAGPDWPGIAWSEDEHVIDDIQAARTAGADLIIPFMHWGWEREPEPGERQRTLARRMIDEGAALVVGTHPHVTQGVELYKGKPIVYSLGNFVFDGMDTEAQRRGWLLRIEVDKTGVAAWKTLPLELDAEGTPYPASGKLTPCGVRGEIEIMSCVAP